METPVDSVTGLRLALTLTILIALAIHPWQLTGATTTRELLKGFQATPDPSTSSFQPLLTDSSGNFSLGFLRVNRTQLALAVIHVLSSETLWQANLTRLARWSKPTQLIFNGSLVISDAQSGVFWSTATNGDRVLLLHTSNLQIQKLDNPVSILWQSFHFPTNTLMENQNFNATMALVSSNGFYIMRLGDKFLGLYARFRQNSDQIYWKHKALEAKADIIEGNGPIHARISSDGYLGMYQTGDTPVDVETFNTFQRNVTGFLRLRLEPDGNLKGYYWDGSTWALNYQAIKDECDLPAPCGSYGLCRPGSGCSCIDNRMEDNSGVCAPPESGELCSENKFWVLRREGIELPYKELMGFQKMESVEQCEGACERNCSCWGAVYNNASGFCYAVDYPIQTVVGVADKTKVGYFKVRKEEGKKAKVGLGIGLGLSGVAVAIFAAAMGFGSYRMWRSKSELRRHGAEESGVFPGLYKDLGSASFRSIEMCNR